MFRRRGLPKNIADQLAKECAERDDFDVVFDSIDDIVKSIFENARLNVGYDEITVMEFVLAKKARAASPDGADAAGTATTPGDGTATVPTAPDALAMPGDGDSALADALKATTDRLIANMQNGTAAAATTTAPTTTAPTTAAPTTAANNPLVDISDSDDDDTPAATGTIAAEIHAPTAADNNAAATDDGSDSAFADDAMAPVVAAIDNVKAIVANPAPDKESPPQQIATLTGILMSGGVDQPTAAKTAKEVESKGLAEHYIQRGSRLATGLLEDFPRKDLMPAEAQLNKDGWDEKAMAQSATVLRTVVGKAQQNSPDVVTGFKRRASLKDPTESFFELASFGGAAGNSAAGNSAAGNSAAAAVGDEERIEGTPPKSRLANIIDAVAQGIGLTQKEKPDAAQAKATAKASAKSKAPPKPKAPAKPTAVDLKPPGRKASTKSLGSVSTDDRPPWIHNTSNPRPQRKAGESGQPGQFTNFF